MSLFKRNSTWWTDFSVNGQRYRESLDTRDWREAQSKEKDLITKAAQGKLSPAGKSFARLGFSEAADRFVNDPSRSLTERSLQTEKERARLLKAHFGTVPVSRITTDMVREWISKRKADGLANSSINRELDVLRGVLKRAKRWYLMADDIRTLKKRESIGRALTHGEKVKLLKTAASKKSWWAVRLALTISLNTTMRAGEILGLRWRDINFFERTLTIRRAKTDAGERVIPLNSEAWAAVLELRERAKVLGNTEPDHFLFCACEGTPINPEKPAEGFEARIHPDKPSKGWRTAWRSLRKAVGLPTFRFHDLRHHAITELAESQTPDIVIMGIAGHVSRKMLEHYSHVRLEAKRRALDGLATAPAKPQHREGAGYGQGSYDTNHDTNAGLPERAKPEVVEEIGGRRRDRTGDLRVANAALSQLS